MYKWPLAINTFNLWDRLKICCFFLNYKNRWSQDKYVREFEDLAAKYVGSKYAIFVSSGSSANDLIAKYTKDRLIKENLWPQKNKVVVCATTWQTNISVWVREGFEPIFIDANLEDFCFDYNDLEKILREQHESIAAVFPTSVLGFTPDIPRIELFCQKYSIPLKFDNCENFWGEYKSKSKFINISSARTSSSSGFIAHHITSGSESGLIFTNSKEEYEYFLLSRAHGLRRNLIPYKSKLDGDVLSRYTNNLVDNQFDFQTLSSNYRSTDIAAFTSIIDFYKWDKHKAYRNKVYNLFKQSLDKSKYHLPDERKETKDCAFCLPIIVKNGDESLLSKVKTLLGAEKIERRSFISGNMLRQIPYQKYGKYTDYPNSEYLNNFALYIGLNMDITEKQVIKLCKNLNKL